MNITDWYRPKRAHVVHCEKHPRQPRHEVCCLDSASKLSRGPLQGHAAMIRDNQNTVFLLKGGLRFTLATPQQSEWLSADYAFEIEIISKGENSGIAMSSSATNMGYCPLQEEINYPLNASTAIVIVAELMQCSIDITSGEESVTDRIVNYTSIDAMIHGISSFSTGTLQCIAEESGLVNTKSAMTRYNTWLM